MDSWNIKHEELHLSFRLYVMFLKRYLHICVSLLLGHITLWVGWTGELWCCKTFHEFSQHVSHSQSVNPGKLTVQCLSRKLMTEITEMTPWCSVSHSVPYQHHPLLTTLSSNRGKHLWGWEGLPTSCSAMWSSSTLGWPPTSLLPWTWSVVCQQI